MSLSGRHNLANALGAIALGTELGIPVTLLQEALATFEGVKRRLEITQFPALTVVEDYAHHPTEIQAALQTLQAAANGRRLVGVFQPHRYSRTKLLAKDFGTCFRKLDLLLITEIYAAGEAPIPGIDTETIMREVRRVEKDKPLIFLPQKERIRHLLDILRPNDFLVVMGAGDIGETVRELTQLCTEGTPSWINHTCGTV